MNPDKTPAARLAWALARARRQGNSLAEIARESGTDQAHLRRLAKGENPLSAEKAEALGGVLGVPPYWLLCWAGPEDEPPPDTTLPEEVVRYGLWMQKLDEDVRRIVTVLGDALETPSAQKELRALLRRRLPGKSSTRGSRGKR